MAYFLNYSSLEDHGDITVFSFKNLAKRSEAIADYVIGRSDRVFILSLSREEDSPRHKVYIFQFYNSIEAEMSRKTSTDIHAYLFECSSYEDAYKTALGMQDISELCYEKTTK